MNNHDILHSKIIGNGKPFVILHGLLGTGDNWLTFAKYISEKGFQVHILDVRNHGNSFHSPIHNYESMSNDLAYYLQMYHLDDIILLGHSMGGKIVMKFACNNSDKIIDKLIVVDVAPKYYPPHHQEILAALNELDVNSITKRKDAEDFLSQKLSDKGTIMFLLKNLVKDDNGFYFLFNLDAITKNIDALGEALLKNEIYKRETCFIRGINSSYIQDNDQILIKEHFPNSYLKTIQNAGHWVHVENYPDFCSTVDTLINKKY